MPRKFYAVKVGKTPGIYETWEECRNQVSGYPGAVYKGFADKEEAMAFAMPSAMASAMASDGTRGGKKQKRENRTEAYVDGSYDRTTKAFSYGMVLFHNGEELHFSDRYDDSELAEMRNVAGEIKGAEAAMRYCLEHDIPDITIYHDYEGIAKWCNGEWKARKAGTIAYVDFYREASARVCIKFVKVKGHSGDAYNELADQLAKKALGLSG